MGEKRVCTFKMNVKVFYTFDYKLWPSLQLIVNSQTSR